MDEQKQLKSGGTTAVAAAENETKMAKKAKKAPIRQTNGGLTGSSRASRANTKSYRLVGGIPDGIRDQSYARLILEAIEAEGGSATAAAIHARLPGVPRKTVYLYLSKFKRGKTLEVGVATTAVACS